MLVLGPASIGGVGLGAVDALDRWLAAVHRGLAVVTEAARRPVAGPPQVVATLLRALLALCCRSVSVLGLQSEDALGHADLHAFSVKR